MQRQPPISPWEQKQLDNPASWVIKCKATGDALLETFCRATVDALDTTRFEAVPILSYLYEVNRGALETR